MPEQARPRLLRWTRTASHSWKLCQLSREGLWQLRWGHFTSPWCVEYMCISLCVCGSAGMHLVKINTACKTVFGLGLLCHSAHWLSSIPCLAKLLCYQALGLLRSSAACILKSMYPQEHFSTSKSVCLVVT
jgi:hypothetical protein